MTTAQVVVVHIVAFIGGWTVGSFLFEFYRDRTLRALVAESRRLGAETHALHEEIRAKIDARARGLALLAELPPDEREMLLTGDTLPADEGTALLHEMMGEDDR